jgi:hypothetical protein
MTEQAVKFTAQVPPAGQPTENTDTSIGSGQQNQAPAQTEAPADSKPLTAADLRVIVQEETVRAFDKLRRTQQSESAKMENRIKALVQEQIGTLQAANVPVDDKARQTIENVIRQRVTQSPENAPEPEAGQPAEGSATGSDDADETAFAMMDAAGVSLEENDPEAANLDRSSKKAYFASLSKALQAKRIRVTTPPGARMPAGGGSPSRGYVDSGMSGMDGLDLYFKSKK